MIAFPFDSRIVGYEDDGMPIYDRASNAEEFARLLAAFLSDGVFNDLMCAVMENEGMTAVVSSGNMMIQGRYGYIEEAESVAFEAADTANPRIDTVVLRRDLSTDVNNIVVAVVKGTPAASPVAPALTRDGTIWELGIADVYIGANVSVITQANITDTRLDESRCGIVAAILTDIDVESFAYQFSALLEQLKEALQDAYDGAVPRDPGVLRIDEIMSLTEAEKGNVYTSLGLDEESLGGMKQELIWTNASPASDFGEQTLTIPCPEKPFMLQVHSCYNKGGQLCLNVTNFNVETAVSGYIIGFDPNSSFINAHRYMGSYAWTDGVITLKFGTGARYGSYGGGKTLLGSLLVPFQIYALYR